MMNHLNLYKCIICSYIITATDVDAAQDTLLHSFRSGTSACLVCIETIKKTDPVSDE